MTKIGLVGVPGSGKTALAETLKKAIEIKDECDCTVPVEIIDDYVPEIERESDLALGFLASYVGNLHVALGRAARERKADAKTLITCGTLLETTTYTAIDGAATLNTDDAEQQQDDIKRLESTMKMLSCLYVDTFKYDHVFYLPPIATTGDEKLKELDMFLQVSFNAFNLVKVIPLMAEADTTLELIEKRCEEALKTLFPEGE